MGVKLVNDSHDFIQNPSPNFLPLDLVMYNLGWRPPGPVTNSSGHITPAAANLTHTFLNRCIGSDQSELNAPILSMAGETVRSEPPYVTISDTYNEFVRHGRIEVVRGRLENVSNSGECATVEVGLTYRVAVRMKLLTVTR